MADRKHHSAGALADRRHSNLAQTLAELAEAKHQIKVEKAANCVLQHDLEQLRGKLNEQATKFADVQYRAYFDQLTGLPNRSLLSDRFQLALASAIRSHHQLGLLFMDLNGFKQINDDCGHAVGDKILQRVAKRIACTIRAIDTVCRYGGDEFVVLLPDVNSRSGVVHVAEKIRRNLSMPYHIGLREHCIGVSIGIAIYPSDGAQFSTLVEKADSAMYTAKASGQRELHEPAEVVTLHSR